MCEIIVNRRIGDQCASVVADSAARIRSVAADRRNRPESMSETVNTAAVLNCDVIQECANGATNNEPLPCRMPPPSSVTLFPLISVVRNIDGRTQSVNTATARAGISADVEVPKLSE